MKKILFTLIIAGVFSSLSGQSPYFFNYQAVLKDDLGQIMTNQEIKLKFSVLDADENGNVLFSETHLTQSSASGVINLLLGMGDIVSGSLENIAWDNGSYFIQIEIDKNGGNDFRLVDIRRFVSVPYALHAETATIVDDADADPDNEIQTLSFDVNSNQLSISNGNTITIPTGGTDADADPENEIQDLNSSRSEGLVTLEISRGGQGTSFDINDADADPDNELQQLSLNNQELSISMGNQVDLSPFATPWKPSTGWDSHGIYYWGDVYMDTVKVDWQLKVGNNNPYGTEIYDSGLFMNDNVVNRKLRLSAKRVQFEDNSGTNYSFLDRDSLLFKTDFGGLLWPISGHYSSVGVFLESLNNRAGFSSTGMGILDGEFTGFMDSRSWHVTQEISPVDVFDRLYLDPDSLSLYNDIKWETVKLGTNKFQKFGYLNLYDGAGNVNASLGTNLFTEFGLPPSTGGLQLFSENNLTVQLESVINGAFLQMYRKDGSWLTTLGADQDGRGQLALNDLDGMEKIRLGIDEFGFGSVNVDGALRVNDLDENTLCTADRWGYTIWDPQQGILGGLEQVFEDPNSAVIYVNGGNGTINFSATKNWMDGNSNGGFAGVFDANGAVSAGMRVDQNQKGLLWGDRFSMIGTSGEQRGLWQTQEDHDAGSLLLYGPNGKLNVSIDYNGINYDYGAINIHDENGNTRAGFFINANTGQGEIYADVKHFKTAYPENPEKEIWYASLEGPEAAAYVRGTASLVNGEAFVSFPDHFSVITDVGSMTVSLTPLYWDTYGLAVIEKSNSGFRVKELKGGQGAYDFDWEVKCVRKGFENYEVVRDKQPDRIFPDAEKTNADKSTGTFPFHQNNRTTNDR